MRPKPVFFAVLALFLPSLFAQTTTPAAKEPDLSGEAVVVEQMQTIIRVAKDGSNVRTFQMKVRVLSDAGVRDAGTILTAYASTHETATIDYVRVHKADGSVVETPTGDAQEVPLPVTQAAPMYSDLRSLQLPVKSLSVGDTLEYHLTIAEKNVEAPGSFWRAMDFNQALPVREEIIELHVPREMQLTVKSKSVQPTVSEQGNERIYRWKHETASGYPKKKEKNDAPVELVAARYEPDVAVTTFRSWAEMGAWYQGVIKDRAVPDAAIQAKADELTKGLNSDDEKIDALYRYVAAKYRYISVSLGIGGVQPHTAAEVFRNQYGDCKDKHTLLQAMLAAEKIDAAPVLIHSSARLNEGLPIPTQFDHMITLVKPGPQQQWLDTTPEVAPSRLLLANLRGKQALVVPPHGEAHLETTPAALPFPAWLRQTVTGTLDAQGTLTAQFDQSARGDVEVLQRYAYHQVPRAKWQELQQAIAAESGFAGEVSAVDAAVPEKTQEPFHVSWAYTRKDFGDWPNRRIPGLTPSMGRELSADTKPPQRAMRLLANEPLEYKAVLTLPEGYTLTPPADVKRVTPFAEYTSTYAVKGQRLEMNRRLLYKVDELPVNEWAAYREFEKAVSDDAGQMMQLTAPPGTVFAAGLSKEDQETAGLLVQAGLKMQSNDMVSANKLLDDAEKRNAHFPGLLTSRGNLAWHTNDLDKAIADFREELDEHPDYLFTYGRLAAAYHAHGDWQQSEEALRAWSKAAPADERPKVQLASTLITEEHYKEAVAVYQEAIATSAQPERLKLGLGIAQLKAGQTDAGKATLHTLMDKSEDAGMLNSAAYELAEADLDLSADETAAHKAVELLERRSGATEVATASKEDMANVLELAATWDTLGWIYCKEKKLTEAESYVRSAWLLNPHGEVGLHLGRIYEAEGRKADALTSYRLGVKTLTAPHLTPESTRWKQEMAARVEALKSEGIREKPLGKTQPGGDELGALRTTEIKSPLHGQYASADFLLLLADEHAEEVRFVKGDESLRAAEAALRDAAYQAPLPTGSHARVLRRGILACTTGAKDCLLVLLPPADTRVD